MPRKGTPIRYGQKHPARKRRQDAEEILQRRIWVIGEQENEVAVKGDLQVGRNQIFSATRLSGYNEVAEQAHMRSILCRN